MRNMPQIPEIQKQNRMTTSFSGYNHQEIISDGEMFEMKNLSGDMYPVLTTREKRGSVAYSSDYPLNGIYARTELVRIVERNVYYGDEPVHLNLSTDPSMMPKKFVSMGAYVCIWPDKKFFNTINLNDYGDMERLLKINGSGISLTLCRNDGTDYDMTAISVGSSAPASPANGDLWIDQSKDTDVLRQYSETTKIWTEVPTVYVKISGSKVGRDLREYDAVDISGMECPDTKPQGMSDETWEKVKKEVAALNGSYVVYGAGTNYIIVAAMLSATMSALKNQNVRIDRTVPDLDYICESNNRIWGCKYGFSNGEGFRKWSAAGWDILINLCAADGTVRGYDTVTVSATAPEDPQEGDLWMDTSDTETLTDHLKKYSGGAWEDEPEYVKLAATGIGAELDTQDEVTVDGLRAPGGGHAGPKLMIQVAALNGTKKIIKAENDYIVIPGIITLNGRGGESNSIVRVNKVTDPSQFLNEIRSCKLGDFRNWNIKMGLSTDSYTVSVGTDGPFTGATVQRGIPVFFKEENIHKIYGTAPSSFQVQTSVCPGIQDGSWRSAVVINDMIYYKSRTDVMVYDGSNAAGIGTKLGKKYFSDARAGTVDGKYYISMKDGDRWTMFCYDTNRGFWFKEDHMKALMFAGMGNELYFIDEENNRLVTVKGTIGIQEDNFEWSAVFGLSGIEYGVSSIGGLVRTDHWGTQYMSRFDIRMYLEEDTEVNMWIEYDSDGVWTRQGTIKGNRMKSFVMPVIPKRCDHLRVKLTGTGPFRIYSINRIMEAGNDG